jgi:hypothetical protein
LAAEMAAENTAADDPNRANEEKGKLQQSTLVNRNLLKLKLTTNVVKLKELHVLLLTIYVKSS